MRLTERFSSSGRAKASRGRFGVLPCVGGRRRLKTRSMYCYRFERPSFLSRMAVGKARRLTTLRHQPFLEA
jgi:hypothetical protein